MTSISFFRVLALGAILAPFTLGADKPLNILFITADDMNADSPGWMGNPLKLTPNIDAFATGNHRFVNNHVSAPICQPSRAAIMTGRVPHRSGALGFDPVNEGVPTLVTLLKAQGYFTAALNKLPHMQPASAFPWDLTFQASAKNPELVGKQVAEAIAAAKAAGKPFLINCNIGDPHRPFYGAKGGKKEGGQGSPIDHPLKAEDVTVPSFLENLPDIREEVSQYTNSVQRLDISFGKALAALKASGQAEDTIVVFMSDHGMSFPFSKATVYRNGTWSPVIIHLPGNDKAQVHEEMTSSTDILPTLLDLVHTKYSDLDGISWVPLLDGEKQPQRDRVFTHVNGVSSGIQFPQRAVNTRTRSLIFSPWTASGRKFKVEAMSGLSFAALASAAESDEKIKSRVDQFLTGIPLAFYDLEKDPDQRKNVIDDPAYKSEVEDLKKSLLLHMEKTGDPQLAAYKAILK